MQIVWTSGITTAANGNYKFFSEVMNSLNRFAAGDWGDICEEDKQANEYAVTHNERILARYETSEGPIYIITEWDRSATTVLFTDEY